MFGAHFMYWEAPDVALFAIRAAYGMDVLAAEGKEGKEESAGRAAQDKGKGRVKGTTVSVSQR